MADPRSAEQFRMDLDSCVWALLELGETEQDIRDQVEAAIEDVRSG